MDNNIDYSLYCQDYNDILKDLPIDLFNRGFAPVSSIVYTDPEILLKYDATLYIQALDGIDTNNLKILDIGCGRGGGPNIYHKYFNFKEVSAFDFNKNSIEYAKSKNSKISYDVQDLNHLKYPSNNFDIITLVDCFWDIKNINSFIRSIINILSRNGAFISVVHLDLDQHIEYSNILGSFFKEIKETNITSNTKKACELKNKEIVNLNISDKAKMFLIEKNIDAYKELSKKQSFKYVCRGEK